jgi:hypothetical protein
MGPRVQSRAESFNGSRIIPEVSGTIFIIIIIIIAEHSTGSVHITAMVG